MANLPFTSPTLVVVFASDVRQNSEIDTRIGNLNTVLRELHRSMFTKWELSSSANLSVFISIFVPILICAHEPWVFTVLSQRQGAERWDICQEFTAWRFSKKVRCFEIHKSLNIESFLLRIEKDLSYNDSATLPECPWKIDEVNLCGPTPGKAAQKVVQG